MFNKFVYIFPNLDSNYAKWVFSLPERCFFDLTAILAGIYASQKLIDVKKSLRRFLTKCMFRNSIRNIS